MQSEKPALVKDHYLALAERLLMAQRQISADAAEILQKWNAQSIPVDVGLLIALHLIATIIKPQAGQQRQMIAACLAMLTDLTSIGELEPLPKKKSIVSASQLPEGIPPVWKG